MHTEDQAKGLWCPMVRLITVEHDGRVVGEAPYNRMAVQNTGNARVPQASRCIASGCAMWRWGDRTPGKMRGFCGLAGSPKP